MKIFQCCQLISCWGLLLLLFKVVFSKDLAGNSANVLVDIINVNRTAQKLTNLTNSPGLGCMALQYAKQCSANCTANNTAHCRVSEDDFTEVFAPDCGVELPTLAEISGHIIGCQSKYLQPSLAFSAVLVRDKRALSILSNKSNTKVGVGLIGAHWKGPFFWCILLSSGQGGSTFVLEDGGRGIEQKKGCFSGSTAPCSGVVRKTNVLSSHVLMAIFIFGNLLQHLYP